MVTDKNGENNMTRRKRNPYWTHIKVLKILICRIRSFALTPWKEKR
jgi:hypothetical protein